RPVDRRREPATRAGGPRAARLVHPMVAPDQRGLVAGWHGAVPETARLDTSHRAAPGAPLTGGTGPRRPSSLLVQTGAHRPRRLRLRRSAPRRGADPSQPAPGPPPPLHRRPAATGRHHPRNGRVCAAARLVPPGRLV